MAAPQRPHIDEVVPLLIDQNGRIEVESPMAFSLADGTIFEVCPYKKGDKVFLVFPEEAFTVANVRRSADALTEAHRAIGADGRPARKGWELISKRGPAK